MILNVLTEHPFNLIGYNFDVTRRSDPALKFYRGVPLMMNSNDRMKDNLANGTSCYGTYVKRSTNIVNWYKYSENNNNMWFTTYVTD